MKHSKPCLLKVLQNLNILKQHHKIYDYAVELKQIQSYLKPDIKLGNKSKYQFICDTCNDKTKAECEIKINNLCNRMF